MKISAGILAGGLSTRMGENKALIKLNNERIIDRIARRLSELGEVIISAASPGDYEDTGFRVVYDGNHGIGPMEGIRQILNAAAEEYVFICAADMPFIEPEIAEYLAGYICSDYDCYVVMDGERIQPLCAIYSKAVLPIVDKRIRAGNYRLRGIIDDAPTKYITLAHTAFDKKLLKNINTRKELAEALFPICFCVSGFSDSGKTGLIERLIHEFNSDGYSVSVLKHSGCGNCAHKHESCHCDRDVRGSDTDRFSRAGAVCSGIYGGAGFSIHSGCSAELGQILRLMSEAGPSDIFILEGLKASELPKIVLLRNPGDGKGLSGYKNVICVVTDIEKSMDVAVPVYGSREMEGIYQCLKEYFGLNFSE